jgi:hypothetical protein
MFDAPTARYFASLFFESRVITLRTFPTLDETLQWLAASARQLLAAEGRQSKDHELK